jgi:hypothetical protein
MPRLEDLLKSKGYTDADLEALKPMLSDSRFRTSIEEQFGAVESERDRIKSEAEAREAEWQRSLAEDYNPRIAAAEKKAIEKDLEAANYRRQVELAKEYGLLPEDHTPAAATAAAPAAGSPAYDPKRHPTFEDVGKFADAEGEAIALSHDLADEYEYLCGKPLFDYVGADGRRGMRALRSEAKAARKNLDAYMADKFDFAGKRAEKEAARQKEHDDAIRRDAEEKTRAELATKYGNPLLRAPMPSRQPFIPTKPQQGKQPWDMTAQERRSGRIERAMTKQMSAGGTVQ